jgi:inhibitor of KinA
MTDDFHIVPAGDAAVLIEFADRIDPIINARAIAVADAVRAMAQPGIRDVVPTFRSVAIYFDPLQTDQDRLLERLRTLASAETLPSTKIRPPIRVPVSYGGDSGPDLADVARFAGATEREVVELHTSGTYRVFMLGFLPGFAYMGIVNARIAAPRRTTPRTNVPAGSVGIAGAQTGIYPFETPGGWQLIGRTTVKPFDLSRSETCLFQAGDVVQFFAVDVLV